MVPDVYIRRHFDAPPDEVFDAWLEPEVMRRWLFVSENGEILSVATDPRMGGAFSILERRHDGDVEHFGEYLEVDRPRRLVFFLQVPKHFPGVTRVSVDISSSGVGCELTFAQSGVDRATVEGNWMEMFGHLAEVLRGRP